MGQQKRMIIEEHRNEPKPKPKQKLSEALIYQALSESDKE